MTATAPHADTEPRHSVAMGGAVLQVWDWGGGLYEFGIQGRARTRTIEAGAADVANVVWGARKEFFTDATAAEWWLMNTLGELETELRARAPERAAA